MENFNKMRIYFIKNLDILLKIPYFNFNTL